MSTAHRTSATSTSARATRRPRRLGPTPVATDRRTRTRLRELCDEVLASYRVASDSDLFTDEDRREAQALLTTVVRPGR
jgi:hypothetical protein